MLEEHYIFFHMPGITSFLLVMKLCLFTGLWCNGIYINSRYDDDIFYPIKKATKRWRMAKPIIHCVNCMASLHSLLIITVMFIVNGISDRIGGLNFAILWLSVAVISSFTNGVIYLIHEVLEWALIHLKNKNKQNES